MPGIVGHSNPICGPSTREVEAGPSGVLGYLGSVANLSPPWAVGNLVSKQKHHLGVVAHSFNPSTREVGAGRF